MKKDKQKNGVKLFGYEAKKIFGKRWLLFLILFLVAANVVIGVITPADESIEGYSERYNAKIEDVVYEGEVNYYMISDKNSQQALYQAGIVEHYTPLEELSVTENVSGVATVINSPYPAFSALLISALAAILLATSEHASPMIMLSYKESRNKICLCKTLMILTVSAVTTVVFTLFCFIGAVASNGCEGLFLPVQGIHNYIYCPYMINALTAILLRTLVSVITVFIVSMISFIVSVLLGKFVFTLTTVLLIIGADVMLSGIFTGLYDLSTNLSIIGSLTGKWLYQYGGVKIIFFMSRASLFALFAAIIGAAAVGGSFALFYKMRVIRSVKTSKKKSAPQSKDTAAVRQSVRHSTLFYETKKLFAGKTVIVTFILLAAYLVAVHYVSYDSSLGQSWYRIYKYYLGEMTPLEYDEQVEYLNTEIEANYLIVEEASELWNAYREANMVESSSEETDEVEISYEEVIEAQEKSGAAEAKLSVLYSIEEQMELIGEYRDRGLDAKLVYSVGWEKLFGSGIWCDLIIILAVVTGIAPYAAIEGETGYSLILSGSFLGDRDAKRKFDRRRRNIMLLYSVAVLTIFNAAEIILIGAEYTLPSVFEYAVGAGIIFDIESLRLIEVIIIHLCLSILGAFIVTMITDMLSRHIKSSMLLMLAMLIPLLFMTVISYVSDLFLSPCLTEYFGYGMMFDSTLLVLIESAALAVIVVAAYKISSKKAVTS